MKSMIIGMGTDLVEVDRVRQTVQRYGHKFLRRVYTETESAYSMSKVNYAERLAGRFAVKEAAMKAIGTGWRRGVTWKDFEVVNEPGGRPTLHLTGAAGRFAEEMAVRRISVSITHTTATAMAVVILEN
jgi:holo-[acyl-carrier protein] synthase